MPPSTSNEHAATAEKIRVLNKTAVDINLNESRAYLISKRFIDILGATVGLILLFPLFLIVAFLIKLEDNKGPVIFKQIRVGKGGKEFYMYKFRSMVANAEELKAQLMEKTKQRVRFLK